MDHATLQRATRAGVRVTHVVLDAALRDTALYPNSNRFVVELAEPIRDAVAVRLVRTEFYDPAASAGTVVIGGTAVPLQSYTGPAAYLALNDYANLQVANGQATAFFARLAPGAEQLPAASGDFEQEPHTHVLRPVQRKLGRFEVRVLTATGAPHPATAAALSLTLAVYHHDHRTL